MRGFSLLEVMIALAIMSGVILTVISAFNYHLSLVDRDQQETTAMLLARAKLEEVLVQRGEAGSNAESGTFAPERPDFLWKIETVPTELSLLKKIILTVTWDAGKRTLSLEDYAAR